MAMWTQAQLDQQLRAGEVGRRLRHTAGRGFRELEVKRGDRVYLVAVDYGHLQLLGRLQVTDLVGQRRAEERLRRRLYEAPDHLLGRGCELRLDRLVPDERLGEVARKTGRLLARRADGSVDPQSPRRIGEISAVSAELFEQVIEADGALPPPRTFVEGGRRPTMIERIERSAGLRVEAIKHHGTDCMVCGFNFEARYGRTGAGMVEVHHLELLSHTRRRRSVDPRTDVVVLCANCHRMLHRESPPMPLSSLRAVLRP